MPRSPAQRTATRTSARNSSAAVEAWLDPEEPPTLGTDGKYIRPVGHPPVEGYSWNNIRGVWVPGKRMLQQMESQAAISSSYAGQRRVRKRINRATHKRKLLRTDFKTDPSSAAIRDESFADEGSDDDEEDEEDEDDEEEEEDDEDRPESLKPPPPPPQQQNWYHPNSGWEEPIPAYDEPYLTLYEKHRTPRQVPHRTETNFCSVASVQQEVRCGICLECVVRTRIVRECRHRFCEPCVERALVSAKECPICRTPIPSRRSLEPDIKFDELLQSVIGRHLRSEEGAEENNIVSSVLQQAINKKREAMISSVEDGNDSRDRSFSEEGDDHSNGVREEVPALIKIMLNRELLDDSPQTTDTLSMPYLRIAGDAPVLVLKNFLRKKHRSKKQYSIWSMLDGGPEILSDRTTLQFVANYLTDEFEGDYMPLYYRETKTTGGGGGNATD